MTKKSYLVICAITFAGSLGVFFFSLHRKAMKGVTGDGGTDIITAQLKEKIALVKTRLMSFKTIIPTMKNIFVATSYERDSRLPLLSADGDGLVFDFGYPSHGQLSEGFRGFATTIAFMGVPSGLLDALRQALTGFGLSTLLVITPAQEWLLKSLMLLGNRVNKKIATSLFLLENVLLLTRLTQTPQCQDLQAVFRNISPLLAPIFESIQLKGGSAFDLFNQFYKLVGAALGRPFSKKVIDGRFVDNPEYKPNGALLSDEQARNVLVCLIVQSLVMYGMLSDAFAKTPQGASAYQALMSSYSLTTVNTYNALLPDYGALKAFVVLECARLLLRLENKTYLSTLSNLLDPILNALGLSLATILSLAADQKPLPEPPAPQITEPALEAVNFDEFDPTAF